MVTVSLSADQVEILKLSAAAYSQQHSSSRQKENLIFYTALGVGTQVQHHGLSGGTLSVSMGDLEELDGYGLIDIRYGSSHYQGSYRVTGEGYSVIEQIHQQERALASSGTPPMDSVGMGFDWETQVWPVLQAVHAVCTRLPSPSGASQTAINLELGRSADDGTTGLVLRKLEQADYVAATIADVEEVVGPVLCEPTPKALERLAGWPTERAETAVAQLLAVLEARIEDTVDTEEASKLRKLRASLQDVGEGVMAGILTKVLTGGG